LKDTEAVMAIKDRPVAIYLEKLPALARIEAEHASCSRLAPFAQGRGEA
jgi:hypothetical protein